MDDSDKTSEIPKSKSQVKREMLALQKLGEELLQLSAAQLSKIPMSNELSMAITAAKSITSHEARRRHMQYIGRLMRKVDPEPIKQALAMARHQHQQTNAEFHRLERWRDLLVEQGDAAIAEVLAAFPQADRQHLRQLLRKIQKERQEGKPMHSTRLLFRYLRELQATNTKEDQQ